MTRHKSRKKPLANENTLEKSLARFSGLLAPYEFTLLLEELKKPLAGGLRVNTLKANTGDLERWRAKYGWHIEPVPFCPAGYRLLAHQTSPGSTLEHRMGSFYLQDTASMLPPELFDFEPGSHPLILDLAASPGGKTTHLISNTKDIGLVIANDASRSRIPALRTVLQTWGAVNTAITCLPGEAYGTIYPETFDAILLDAPCSMDGLRATDAHPLRPITDNERGSLVRRQIALLRSALAAARPGGQVVYSTCTLAPEEDEAVLDAILNEYPGMIEIENLTKRKNIYAPALAADSSQIFDPSIQNAFRLWPHIFHTIGFFAAQLRKIGPILGVPKKEPNLLRSSFQYSSISKLEEQSILDSISTLHGVDLVPIIEKYQLVLAKQERTIRFLPEKLIANLPSLPLVSAGMLLADVTPGGLELSHDFCARFGELITSKKIILNDAQRKAWLRGEDLPRNAVSTLIAARIVIIRDNDGNFLGRGRVTAERIKNLLPRRVLL